MDGGEGGDLPGLHRGFFGEAERTEHHVEGVADVPELGVEFIVVTIKEVLQALEQVRGEVRSVAGRIAVRADGVDPREQERPIARG